MIEIHPIKYDGLIQPIGLEKLAGELRNLFPLQPGDILVVTHKAIARAEGRVVDLSTVVPSTRAQVLAETIHDDPRVVELILRESTVMRVGSITLLTRMPNGMVCNSAGIDTFSVGSEQICLLPLDADNSARILHQHLSVPIIISDTQSRFYRHGAVNIAIGSWGLKPTRSYIGQADAFGKVFMRATIAVIDELAAAVELVMGKLDGVPAAVVRGYHYEPANEGAQIVYDSKRYSRLELNYAIDNKPPLSSD